MEYAELKWIAAIIDGEGSISLNKGFHKGYYTSRPCKRGFHWSPKVHVFNTSRELLEYFQKISGFGCINTIDYDYPSRKEMKTGYDLVLRNDEIRSLLPQIKDSLIVRKKHATLLIEALEIMKMHQSLGPVEDITVVRDKRLEAIYWELRLLNARGKHGQEKVLAEIAGLPSDPCDYSRETFEAEMKMTLEAKERRRIEKQRARVKRWRRKNPEVYRRSQRASNKRMAIKITERYHNDPQFREKILDRQRELRKKPERQEYMHRWREKHQEKVREFNQKYWQETKCRLESDPEFAKDYRARVNERAGRHRLKVKEVRKIEG